MSDHADTRPDRLMPVDPRRALRTVLRSIAVIEFMIGAMYLALPGERFSGPGYVVIRAVAPIRLWGVLLLVAAVVVFAAHLRHARRTLCAALFTNAALLGVIAVLAALAATERTDASGAGFLMWGFIAACSLALGRTVVGRGTGRGDGHHSGRRAGT